MTGKIRKWMAGLASVVLLLGCSLPIQAEEQLIGFGANGVGSITSEGKNEAGAETETSGGAETEPSGENETGTKSEDLTETEDQANTETEYKNGRKVCIDPGHQSPEIDMSEQEPIAPGATETKAKATTGTEGAYTGLGEYELNLQVSLLLRDELEERGYDVVMTRENNETAISNRERAELAASEGADILVRIHANGSDDHSVSGALTMVPSQENPYVGEMAEECYALGESILAAYCEKTGFSSLGVQYYDNMSGINWSTIPVTILEMGFMTNETEDYTMADENFWPVMAEGIADGIDDYFGLDHDAAQKAVSAQAEASGTGTETTVTQTGASSAQAETSGTGTETSVTQTEDSDEGTSSERAEAFGDETEASVIQLTDSDKETSSAQAETSGNGTETSEEIQRMNELQDSLYVFLSENTSEGETWAIAVLDPETEQGFEIDNTQMQAASLIKLYIMGAVYEQYQQLQENYGQENIDTLLYNMITVSDNDAANTLVEYLGAGDTSAGMECVNEFCTAQGFSDTVMGRLLLAPADNGDNLTSVSDCAEFLRRAYLGEFAEGETMVNLLKQQQRTHKIPAGLPEGVTVANKTGELDTVENDVAVVFADTPYILCVMSENLADVGAAQSEIAEISSVVYKGLTGN